MPELQPIASGASQPLRAGAFGGRNSRRCVSRRTATVVFLLLAAAILPSCSAPADSVCKPGYGSPMLVFDLLFGRAVAGRADVSDREWRVFLDDTVTLNLPNGYTVHEGYGAWMSPVSRKTLREQSYLIRVALPDVPESLAAVSRIRTQYQERFRQEQVGMIVTHACGTF